jgi:lipoprotein-releasing system ATP-binding protein
VSALVAAGLGHAFRRPGLEPVVVLRELELTLEEGELLAVRGASGSGKSTLLHVLGGMLRPELGSVALDGRQPWEMSASARAGWRNAELGFVFQQPHLIEELDALENVLVPGWLAGRPKRELRREAEGLLGRLGLEARMGHRPSELSGGEAQRVAVARALLLGPRLVLADEPTGSLDETAGRLVFEEFRSLQRERGFLAILATHDASLAESCDRSLRIARGRLT